VLVCQQYDLPFVNHSPRLIIDGGANVGFATRFFAHKFPQARILAVEPDPSNFALLVENTARLPNVTPLQAAIWSRTAGMDLENPSAPGWSRRVRETGTAAGGVQAVTIPDLLELAKLDQIDVLKLDIEGAEVELFSQGSGDWLDRVETIVVELHDRFRPGCAEAFYGAIRGHGFQEWRKGENLFLTRSRS